MARLRAQNYKTGSNPSFNKDLLSKGLNGAQSYSDFNKKIEKFNPYFQELTARTRWGGYESRLEDPPKPLKIQDPSRAGIYMNKN
mmetsp:Transcript_33373/g.51187  ORF Transcript_33373/g.51187 Transcript_33373/m.51187 type:complete len:85 (+) Transcript_33373:387-641(+)